MVQVWHSMPRLQAILLEDVPCFPVSPTAGASGSWFLYDMTFCKVSDVEDCLLRVLPFDIWERVLRCMGEPCPMIHCYGMHWLRIPIRHGLKGQRFLVEQNGALLTAFFCVSLQRLRIYVQTHPWMPSVNVVDRVLLTWAGGFGSCYDMAKAVE